VVHGGKANIVVGPLKEADLHDDLFRLGNQWLEVAEQVGGVL
jgi:hypothetical protein